MKIKYWEMGNRNLNEWDFKNPIRSKKMKIKAKATISIADGQHTGKIVSVDYETEPYDYTTITIEETKSKVNLRLGVPTSITENTALGKVLKNFGVKIEPEKEYDIEEHLKKDMNVSFMVMNETTEKGTFTKILPSSLKPLKKNG